MADEVGDKTLEPKADELEKIDSSYRLINIPSEMLPHDYKNLIIAPFLNSLRYGNDLFKLIDKDSYYTKYGKYVLSLIQRPGVVIRCAVLRDETVLGWSIIENKILHYVWVKKEVRRQGIGKELMPKDFESFSHITNIWMNIWPKFEVRFDPFV